jgi:tRNA (guanine-N7-)-methyltransferase
MDPERTPHLDSGRSLRLEVGRKGRAIPPFRQERSEFELSLDDLLSESDPAARWAQAFGASRPLRVEIGVGNSDFLIDVAIQEPDFNYLGFEYSPKRVWKFLKRVKSRGIGNIRMLRIAAVRGLAELVAPDSVDAFFINFPDPWPKKRHAKHRLIQPPTAELLVRLLVPGGGLSLRSDDEAYSVQMLAVLDPVQGLENTAGPGRFAPVPRHPIPTAYEIKYRNEGRTIHYLEYRKRNGRPVSTGGTEGAEGK